MKKGQPTLPLFVAENRTKRSVAALDEEEHGEQAADGEVADGGGAAGHAGGHVEADDADPHRFGQGIHLAAFGKV